MTFSKKAISLAGILLCCAVQLGAQVRQTREEYISRYMSIAVAHMERYVQLPVRKKNRQHKWIQNE